MAKLKQIHMESTQPQNAAVLLLVYPITNGEINLVLIRYNHYIGFHSGQISLTGGKQGPQDNDLWVTAFRESF